MLEVSGSKNKLAYFSAMLIIAAGHFIE